jgi:hypothetical protein
MTAAGKDATDLESRLRRVEDQLAIYQLISSYGPLADGNLHEETAELWTEDGLYDIDLGRFEGRGEIAGFLRGPLHQGLTAGGCSHILSLPHIVFDGDRAVATNYSQTVKHEDGEFSIFRSVISRWELVRTTTGWKVERRLNQALNGSAGSREILTKVLDGKPF